MVRMPDWPKVPLWKKERQASLEHCIRLLGELGNPHDKLPPTIHIAGTNGKGSTVAILNSILTQSKLKVHTYTSPHLLEFNERIKLNGQDISDYQLKFYLDKVKLVAEKLQIELSFFEGTTIAAFLAFVDEQADILILETGLGGRLDCTNVIKSPIATIITPISYDHTEVLGSNIKQIAIEKAGIIKTGVPCIIGPQMHHAYEILLGVCERMNSPSFCYEYDFIAEKTNTGFTYKSQNLSLDLPNPALRGDHQILNAASAIATVLLLNNYFKISQNNLTIGLQNTKWPGRIEKVESDTVLNLTGTSDIEIYLDGAHNDSGAQALAEWAKNLDGNVYLILGMTRKRNPTSFCSYFSDIVKHGIAVNVMSEPSNISASSLATLASESGIDFSFEDNLLTAIKTISNARKPETKIIITGSLFLAADFYQLL